MLKTPDAHARIELCRYVHPVAAPGNRAAMANELGLRNVCFEVEDLPAILERLQADGYGLVGDLGVYQDAWRMAYVRGPRVSSSRSATESAPPGTTPPPGLPEQSETRPGVGQLCLLLVVTALVAGTATASCFLLASVMTSRSFHLTLPDVHEVHDRRRRNRVLAWVSRPGRCRDGGCGGRQRGWRVRCVACDAGLGLVQIRGARSVVRDPTRGVNGVWRDFHRLRTATATWSRPAVHPTFARAVGRGRRRSGRPLVALTVEVADPRPVDDSSTRSKPVTDDLEVPAWTFSTRASARHPSSGRHRPSDRPSSSTLTPARLSQALLRHHFSASSPPLPGPPTGLSARARRRRLDPGHGVEPVAVISRTPAAAPARPSARAVSGQVVDGDAVDGLGGVGRRDPGRDLRVATSPPPRRRPPPPPSPPPPAMK